MKKQKGRYSLEALSNWEARHQDRVTSRPPMPFDLSKSRLPPVFYPIRGSRAHQEVNASRPTYRNFMELRWYPDHSLSLSLSLSYCHANSFVTNYPTKATPASRGESNKKLRLFYYWSLVIFSLDWRASMWIVREIDGSLLFLFFLFEEGKRTFSVKSRSRKRW